VIWRRLFSVTFRLESLGGGRRAIFPLLLMYRIAVGARRTSALGCATDHIRTMVCQHRAQTRLRRASPALVRPRSRRRSAARQKPVTMVMSASTNSLFILDIGCPRLGCATGDKRRIVACVVVHHTIVAAYILGRAWRQARPACFARLRAGRHQYRDVVPGNMRETRENAWQHARSLGIGPACRRSLQ